MISETTEEILVEKFSLSNGSEAVAWLSESCPAPQWDDFLIATESGEHEQSSSWAEVKALDGWNPLRCMVRCEGRIIAGFQLLHRVVRPAGRIGYISRGPAYACSDPVLLARIPRLIEAAATHRRIHAVILHPPRTGEELLRHLPNNLYFPNHLVGLILGTLELDLLSSEDEILERMRANRRRNIRKGTQSELVFREGERGDLQKFFHLMKMTCARQKTAPNPNSLCALELLWEKYAPRGNLKLFLSSLNGADFCGGLVIPFRDRAIQWKVGWSGEHRELYPNDFLHWGMIKWARANGYRYFDFGGIDIDLAEAIRRLQGPVPEEFARSSSYYKLGYGGDLVRFPPGRIYFRPAPLRWIYALWSRIRALVSGASRRTSR